MGGNLEDGGEDFGGVFAADAREDVAGGAAAEERAGVVEGGWTMGSSFQMYE
jgi:hypothetical protein